MKNNTPRIIKTGLFILIILFLSNCGIYDYPFIYPVPIGTITGELNTNVYINTGTDNIGNQYFTHYIIFYKIYISDTDNSNPIENINSVLASDYSRINNISGSQSIGGAAAYDLITRSLRFSEISLEGTNIDIFLSNASNNINIDFTRDFPSLSIDNINYYRLTRRHITSTSSNERYFLNNINQLRYDIINNITNGENRDVQDNTSATKTYSHALMYIMASGMNTQNFVPVYSSPTYIGIFRLR